MMSKECKDNVLFCISEFKNQFTLWVHVSSCKFCDFVQKKIIIEIYLYVELISFILTMKLR